MTDVTQILREIELGNGSSAEKLLPLVYDELRRLAASMMYREAPEHTLQPTALVHEAYVRLVDVDQAQSWNGRGHFYAAAAEAMRRILVEWIRRKRQLKRGGDHKRVQLDDPQAVSLDHSLELLEVDELLDGSQQVDDRGAVLVKLRCFGGFSITEAAELIGISSSSAYEHWNFAKAWLRRARNDDS